MAELLDYPGNSPLVVEGYAVGGGPGQDFRRAGARRCSARVSGADVSARGNTYRLMPIGSAAEGAPSGDGRWSGLALTMFVDTDRLAAAAPAAAGAA